MLRGGERILTTHTGSLPRPTELLQILDARQAGEPVDEAVLESGIERAVGEVVARQHQLGIDIPGDGEMSKPSYSGYVTERMAGFGEVVVEGEGMAAGADLLDFPEYARDYLSGPGARAESKSRPTCTGPLAYANRAPLERDLRNLRSALDAVDVSEGFVPAASPAVIGTTLVNQYYDGPVAYLDALADAMRVEYESIHRAGFLLQIDCPDLALSRHMRFAHKSLAEFRKIIASYVEVLNHAVSAIPPEAMRMHVCWGNYAGPHHRDVPLVDILDIVLAARPAGLVLESSNPRHAHEWALFADLDLPDGKYLIPGVIESSSSYVEHPEVVAQRIERFASVVGADNVVAGTDCGFSSVAGFTPVHAELVWAKLGSLVEGARIATRRLFG